jgi:hypothetical protein
VCSHEILVRGSIATLGARDELALVLWSAHHVLVLHRRARGGSPPCLPG